MGKHAILTQDPPADAYLYALIIPVLPFALVERVQLRQDDVQSWIGILLAAYGAGLLVGSRKVFFFSILIYQLYIPLPHLLTNNPSQAIAGWFADRGNSRQGPYLWGLIALAISTIAFSLGRSITVLFVGRLVQGFSSAIVHTVGMAILADTVDQEEAGSAMGFTATSNALGVVIGPVVGGVLYHSYGYLAVFISGYAVRETPLHLHASISSPIFHPLS